MSKQPSHKDVLGYLLGILTFLAGIALLGLVFSLAYQLFRAPLAGVESTGKIPNTAIGIGAAIFQFIRQMLLLVVCAWIASKIANLGVSKYYAANQIMASAQEHPTVNHKHQSAVTPTPATPADRPDDTPSKPIATPPPPQPSIKPEKG